MTTPRIGPRPLPLHLAAALMSFASSQAALPLLKRGSLAWSPPLEAEARRLESELAEVALEPFAAAVDAELRQRAGRLVAGIERYRGDSYRRSLPEPPLLWQRGELRLLDYGEKARGRPLLVVPSLINRAYILDLLAEKSLLRFLARQGLRPLLVDWGSPDREERRFGLADYMRERLQPALAEASALAGEPVPVLGYCMGGTLALALAACAPERVASLALLAAPWDFHAERAAQARLVGALAPMLERAFAGLGVLPVDLLQSLFAALDPLLAMRKFIRFGELAPRSAAARDFVALEDWLNDGVPLALPVAVECLRDWYGANVTARGRWRLGATRVDPARIALPALVVVPAQDRIVPPGAARALGEALPMAELMAPALGHIGMVVSERARAAVWEPLARWLLARKPAAARRPRRPRR